VVDVADKVVSRRLVTVVVAAGNNRPMMVSGKLAQAVVGPVKDNPIHAVPAEEQAGSKFTEGKLKGAS